jgi:peptidoglycan/LPS O-acetylase OafA/YrhL
MTDHRPELRPLTAFRFFAALAVFFRHVYPWLKGSPDMPSVVHSFMNDGFCGVTFFFVLSGFILTYNYRLVFVRLSGPSVWKFYAARVARIWPVHLLTLGLAVVVRYPDIMAAPDQFIDSTIANLTLTQSYFSDETIYFSLNTVSWSLSDEIFFYALFPLVVWAMHAVGLDRPRRSSVLAIGLWAVAMACVLIGLDDPLGFWMWYINPLFRVLDFLTGVALGQVFLGLNDKGIRGPSPKWASLLEVSSLVLVAVALMASPSVPYLLRRSVYYTPFFGMVILVFAYQRGFLSRLLSGKVLRLLGEVSFSFYMLHFLLIRLIDRYPHATHLGDLPPLLRSIAVFAISLMASIGCYRWFEVPARTRVRDWLVRRLVPQRTNQTPHEEPRVEDVGHVQMNPAR